MPLSAFDAAAIVIVLAAVLGYANHRLLGLPHTIGLTVMGALASLVVVGIARVLPTSALDETVRQFMEELNFADTLMNGMLSFLLFAGALHVDLAEIRRGKWHVLALSSVGVLISTVIVGFAFNFLAGLAGLDVPLLWCLVFGALISPTDPVAVLGILKVSRVPPSVQATIGGESLFNDGIGVVVFSILLAAATGAESFTWIHAAELFLVEAVGGALLGLAAGWIAYRALATIDEYNVETLITLAVVMGGYALAHALSVSGPVAMAVAGLLIGNHGVTYAMSEVTRDYLLKFWSLVDEILNSVLFLLIGLEAIALTVSLPLVGAALGAIPIVLAARLIAVAGPLGLLQPFRPLPRVAFPILWWGGLRGGISIALALSLPAGDVKAVLLATTYAVVLFSVLVQGSTIGLLVERHRG